MLLGNAVNIVGAITNFTCVVESGTLASAARSLGVSAASVSQNIARLEEHLGVRLLTRTTRQMALTEAGRVYYDKVRHIPRELDLAKQAVDKGLDLQEHLTIATLSSVGRHLLAPLLPAFGRRYPRLAIELVSANHRADHLREKIDVSIRIAAQLDDRLVARVIASRPFLICASPEYLKDAGTPTSPEELRSHSCLVLRYATNGRFLPWEFVRDGVHFDAPVNPSMISDDIDMLAQMAVNGGGITRLADFVAQPLIERGLLVTLFDQLHQTAGQAMPEPMQIFACVTDHTSLTPKVRALIDYLKEALNQC